ncbi:hypothetical protein KY334_00320 [Candidatus Woesearchaeota archaeon]|nr:hypothetical protein [Candidatus Woesearchaeota archaeon]
MFFNINEGEEELIERIKINGSEINIYHTNKRFAILSDKHKMNQFLDSLKELENLDKFSSLDIIIHINNSFKINIKRAKELVDKDQRLGYINIPEFRRGKYRVHLNFDFISLKYFQTNFKDEDPPKVFYKLVRKVIAHEMTHLWHLQINHVSRIVDKKRIKLSKALQKLYENSGSVSFWEKLRNSLMNVNELVVLEGLAKFYQEYKDMLDLNEESVKDYYHKSLKEAKELNECFEDSYSKLSEKNSWDEADHEIKKLNLKINYSMQIIGAHIFQSILYFEKIDIEKLSRFGYVKLLKEYEKVAKKHNFKPVISLRSKNGEFDVSEHIKELTKIRKKTLK